MEEGGTEREPAAVDSHPCHPIRLSLLSQVALDEVLYGWHHLVRPDASHNKYLVKGLEGVEAPREGDLEKGVGV